MATLVDAISRANGAILEKMAGVPSKPATPETDADPKNPNVISPSSDAAHSLAGSTAESNRAPQRSAPHLRLV
jgi:hypothetical protein